MSKDNHNQPSMVDINYQLKLEKTRLKDIERSIANKRLVLDALVIVFLSGCWVLSLLVLLF